MTEPNPYAPPANFDLSPGYASEDTEAWQENGKVVFFQEGRLPARCVRCNAPATSSLTQKLYWHHPALYVLVFFPGVLIYVIVALIFRKTATVDLGLCETHRRRRLMGLGVGWGGLILALTLFYLAVVGGGAPLAVGGIILLIAAIVAGLVVVPQVQPARIDADLVYLKAGQAFVASLPHSPRRPS